MKEKMDHGNLKQKNQNIKHLNEFKLTLDFNEDMEVPMHHEIGFSSEALDFTTIDLENKSKMDHGNLKQKNLNIKHLNKFKLTGDQEEIMRGFNVTAETDFGPTS